MTTSWKLTIALPLVLILSCMVVVVSNRDFLQNILSLGAGSSCPTSSSESYGKRGLNPPDPNAESNPEIVLAKRGYGQVQENLGLVSYGFPAGEGPDPNAPQLGGIIGSGATFSHTYRVHKWNYAGNNASSEYEDRWPVNLLGLSSYPGQSVYAPKNGYNVGGGYQYMLIYASPTSVTINVTGDDSAIVGYALHIDGFCVDPNLLALYRQLHSQGRREMPALSGGQKIGVTNGNEVRVAVRDSGDWMDPRSKGDWWQDMSTFPNPTGQVGSVPPTPKPTKKPKQKKPTATPIPPSSTLVPGVSPSVTPRGFVSSPTAVIPTQEIDEFEEPVDEPTIPVAPVVQVSFFAGVGEFLGNTVGSVFRFLQTVAP